MEFPRDIYEKSKFRTNVPYDQLTATSDEYKAIREKIGVVI